MDGSKKKFRELELNCDEATPLDSGADDKRRYAELLLKTAGNKQGFNTCLSALVSISRQ